MAHRCPPGGSERGSDDSQQPRQEPSPNYQLVQNPTLAAAPLSTLPSRPIAIVRREGTNSYSTDDDDDEYFPTIDADGDVDAIGFSPENTGARSLPLRFLRAPHLGSVPMNFDSLTEQSMLPPPMSAVYERDVEGSLKTSLDENKPSETSYGSLRDSHAQRRFFDGPASYRDKRTGSIRNIDRRVKFHTNTVGSMPSPTVNISERMRQRSQDQKQKLTNQKLEKQHDTTTSSLSAMIEASTLNGPGSEPTLEHDAPFNARAVAFSDEDSFRPIPTEMLSASHTAFEILLNTPILKERRVEHDTESGSQTELPRDADGNNALLSRSISDPTPILHSQRDGASLHSSYVLASMPPQTVAPFAGSASTVMEPSVYSTSNSLITDALLEFSSDDTYSRPTSFASTQAGNSNVATNLTDIPPEYAADIEYNPDTEGAFDMDFE